MATAIELDAFRETPLDNVQTGLIAALRKRFGTLPRKLWVGEAGSNRYEALTCLRLAIGNGHYVGYCRDDAGREAWQSFKHDTVSVRLAKPNVRNRGNLTT